VKKISPDETHRVRLSIALLLSFSILITPIAAIAAPKNPAGSVGRPTKRSAKKLGSVAGEVHKVSEGLFVNARVPEPAPGSRANTSFSAFHRSILIFPQEILLSLSKYETDQNEINTESRQLK